MFSYEKENAAKFTSAINAEKARIKFDEHDEFCIKEI